MNAYFCALLLCGVAIIPVRLSGAARIGRRSGYRITLRVLYVPVLSRGARFDHERGRFRSVQRKGFSSKSANQSAPEAFGGMNEAVVRLLLSRAFRYALARAVTVKRFRLEAHVAFENAMHTALFYAALRAALITLTRVFSAQSAVQGDLRADFSGKGGSLSVSGIIRARLGMLVYAAAVLACVALRERRKAKAGARREEGYAASH